MAQYRLSGFAFVTGGAQGIGKESALTFAEAGAAGIAFADLKIEEAERAAAESKQLASNPAYKAIAIKVDVTNEEEVDNAVETAKAEFGRIDYAVHSAGVGNTSGAVTGHVKTEGFKKIIDTNVMGTMYFLRAMTKVMSAQEPLSITTRYGERSLGRGSIVVLGSINSFIPAPGMLPYVTSKHAIIGLVKSAAMDNLQNHVRVNSVCPAWVDTPMMQASLQRVPALGAMIKKLSPLQRAAKPDEVANAVLFLTSSAASFVNGENMIVEAGTTLTVSSI